MTAELEQYALLIDNLRRVGRGMIADGQRRVRLADELEKTLAVPPPKPGWTDLLVAPPKANVTLEQLKKFIADGGTGRAEHVAAKLGTTPDQIRELVAQPGSGLHTRDRGWIKAETQSELL